MEHHPGSDKNLHDAIADLQSALVAIEKAGVPLAAAYAEMAISFCEDALAQAAQRASGHRWKT